MPTDLWAFGERAARAVARADRGCAGSDAVLASLMPSSRSSQSLPTPLIDAAYEAVRFDEDWAINSRRALSKAVKAMVCVPTRTESSRPSDKPSRPDVAGRAPIVLMLETSLVHPLTIVSMLINDLAERTMISGVERVINQEIRDKAEPLKSQGFPVA
jgi:hypothetical protein